MLKLLSFDISFEKLQRNIANNYIRVSSMHFVNFIVREMYSCNLGHEIGNTSTILESEKSQSIAFQTFIDGVCSTLPIIVYLLFAGIGGKIRIMPRPSLCKYVLRLYCSSNMSTNQHSSLAHGSVALLMRI